MIIAAIRRKLCTVTILVLGAFNLYSATFTVTNVSDSGAGSLRAAITSADAAPGTDTINFSLSGTFNLASALPTITDTAETLIDGTGQTVIISGSNASAIFVVTGGTLSLSNLILSDGTAVNGGAVSITGGNLTITNTTLSSNTASGDGGAIWASGANVTINSTTFSSNTSTGNGGALANIAASTTSITNATFSGNTATTNGGALYTNTATLTITSSTIADNTGLLAGGIVRISGTTTIRNSIIDANAPLNCSGLVVDGGNNIDSGASCGFATANGSQNNTDPLIGPLTNNGGTTQTRALLITSPAIEGVVFNGSNFSPVVDQRGVSRPQAENFDIGAFENNDADFDTVLDAVDNCPEVANLSQLDTDSDGIGDACDDCAAGPNDVDSDGDGIADDCDTCNDIDQDGFGDGNFDTSGCEHANQADNCPFFANPDQDDLDNDDIGDRCDTIPAGATFIAPEVPPLLPPPVAPLLDPAGLLPVAEAPKADIEVTEKAPAALQSFEPEASRHDYSENEGRYWDELEEDGPTAFGCSTTGNAQGSLLSFVLAILAFAWRAQRRQRVRG